MKILQISAFFPAHGGGIEAVAGHLASGLGHSGITCTWMAGARKGDLLPPSRERVKLVPVKYFDPVEPVMGLPCPIWGFGALFGLWKRVAGADLIHLHDYLYMPSMAAYLFAKCLGKPVLITQHIGELPLRSRLFRALISILNRSLGAWILGHAQQAVFVAPQVASYFSQLTSFKRPPLVIANGVDHTMYMPATRIDGLGITRLLFVGRFVEKKGVQLLRTCLDLPNTHWIFIGWGPQSPRNWGVLPDNIEIIEHANPQDIVPYYQQADLLVLPSVGEGFPLVVQESLACGTPVLVSRQTAEACPSIDENCIFQVSLDEDDPSKSLRRMIFDLISAPERLDSARTAAATFAQQWSWDACTERYIKAYGGICA